LIALRIRVVGIALAGLLAAAPAAAQPRGKDRIPERTLAPESTELFRGLLDFHGLQPLTVSQFDSLPPGDVVVVVFGVTAAFPEGRDIATFTRTVLQRGGSVLIASDYQGPIGRLFPAPSDLAVTGERVAAHGEESRRFRNRAECPYVAPTPSLLDLGAAGLDIGSFAEEKALFFGRRQIATNRPSALFQGRRQSPYDRNVLAQFPPGCEDGRTDLPLAENRVFAVGGSGGPGELPFRCLVLADQSVFSNQMLQAADETGGPATQNLAFANDVVRFLRGPDGAVRKHCLFVENGVVRDRFDVVKFSASAPISVPPLPIPSFTNPEFQRKLTDLVNEQVAARQDRDSFNNFLASSDNRYTTTLRALALGLGVLAIVYFLSRVWRQRHEPDRPPVPTDTGRIAGSAPPGSIARRREELLQSGNYTPLVQDYLRELFGERGLAAAHDPSPRTMPALRVSGPDAKALKSHIHILWNMAYGPVARPVTYSRWKELEPMIEVVRRAADEGRWGFAGGQA
jgi:hypothetical protein